MRRNVSGLIISSGEISLMLFGLAAVQQHNGLLHYPVSSWLWNTFKSQEIHAFIIQAAFSETVFSPGVSVKGDSKQPCWFQAQQKLIQCIEVARCFIFEETLCVFLTRIRSNLFHVCPSQIDSYFVYKGWNEKNRQVVQVLWEVMCCTISCSGAINSSHNDELTSKVYFNRAHNNLEKLQCVVCTLMLLHRLKKRHNVLIFELYRCL